MTNSNGILDNTTFAVTKSKLKKNEDEKEFPYLDIKGKVTIAMGKLVNTVTEFVKLELSYVDDERGIHRPANNAEKRQAFEQMVTERNRLNGKFNNDADTYKYTTKVRMSQTEMDKAERTAINTRANALRTSIGAAAWDKLTPPAKASLIDIEFANGDISNGDMKKGGFPSLIAAAKTGNKAEMAYQSFFYANKATGQRPNMDRLAGNVKDLADVPEAVAKRFVDALIFSDDMTDDKKKGAMKAGIRQSIEYAVTAAEENKQTEQRIELENKKTLGFENVQNLTAQNIEDLAELQASRVRDFNYLGLELRDELLGPDRKDLEDMKDAERLAAWGKVQAAIDAQAEAQQKADVPYESNPDHSKDTQKPKTPSLLNYRRPQETQAEDRRKARDKEERAEKVTAAREARERTREKEIAKEVRFHKKVVQKEAATFTDAGEGFRHSQDQQSQIERATEVDTFGQFDQSDNSSPSSSSPTPADTPPDPGQHDDPDESYYHNGGLVTDGTPDDGTPVAATVQEGEYLVAPKAVQALGVDVLTLINELGSSDIPILRRIISEILPHDSEPVLRKVMSSRQYWDQFNPQRAETYARVQRGFDALYPSGVFRAKDGGMILDGDVDTHLDDLPAVLGEGSFVLTRAAVDLLGPELLDRLNNAARFGEIERISKFRQRLGAARKRPFKALSGDARALMRTPAYINRNHVQHNAAYNRVAELFRHL